MERANEASLSMSQAKSMEQREADFFRLLPPGFRFKPRDEELVEFYLKRKIQKKKLPPNIFRDVDLYNYDPETLTAMHDNASSNGVMTEWFFFTPRERKYANGNRPRRCAGHGYWKATGKDKEVFSCGEKVGLKKTLVFYEGKAPKGDKTNWTMHEYVLIKAPLRQRLGKEDMRLDDWVLCRVYKKLNKVDKDAVVVQNEGQVMENGFPSVDQNEEFDVDADAGADDSNMPMLQQPSLMPASNQQCDYMLQQHSEPFYPMQGHDPLIPVPFSCVGSSNWSQLPPMQQQFSNVCPSNQSYLPPMQQQQFSNVCPSNWSQLPLMQQQQFPNVCPSNQSHLMPIQQQSFVTEPEHALLPLMQQQQFSNVGPSNESHLLPIQQQCFVAKSEHAPLPPMLQQQFSNVCPSNESHLPLIQQQRFVIDQEHAPLSPEHKRKRTNYNP